MEHPTSDPCPAFGSPTERHEPTASFRWADVERFLVAKGAYVAGILLLIVGSVLYLKYAIDNNWITVSERIALGMLVGLAGLMTGARLSKPKQRWTSEGMIGLGSAFMYLSLWASCQPQFDVLPLSAASGLMALVTTAIALLAYRRDSETLAFSALLGGSATPLLLNTGAPAQAALTGYLTFLDLAMLTLSLLRGWHRLACGALVAASLYAVTLLPSDTWTPHLAAVAIGVLSLPFVILPLIRRDHVNDAIAAASAVGFATHLLTDLHDERATLAIALFAAAAFFLGCARLGANRVYAWLAAGYVALAIPAQIQGNVHLTAWAIEATLVGVIGIRTNDRVFAYGSFAALAALLLADLAAYGIPFDVTPDRAERFLTLLATAAGISLVATEIRKTPALFEDTATILVPSMRVVAHVLTLWNLSTLAYDFENSTRGAHIASLDAAQVSLSIVWILFASVCFALGARNRDALARWEGITLIAVTLAKVLLVDLATLPSGPRIISSLAVGAVLTLLSFVYQLRNETNDAGKGASA